MISPAAQQFVLLSSQNRTNYCPAELCPAGQLECGEQTNDTYIIRTKSHPTRRIKKEMTYSLAQQDITILAAGLLWFTWRLSSKTFCSHDTVLHVRLSVRVRNVIFIYCPIRFVQRSTQNLWQQACQLEMCFMRRCKLLTARRTIYERHIKAPTQPTCCERDISNERFLCQFCVNRSLRCG